MEEHYIQIARAVADDVAPTLGARVRSDLETAIATRALRQTRYDAATTIALAAFILSVAQFGYSIARDLREDRRKTRKGRAELRQTLLQRMEARFSSELGATYPRKQIIERTVETLIVQENDD